MSKKSSDEKEPIVGEIIKSKAHDAKKFLKRAGWLALAGSVVLGILGIILILWPNTAIATAAWVLGLCLIAAGAYKLIEYFAVRGMYDFTNNGLLSGLIALLVGIIIIILRNDISGFFRIIIGIWMVYAALTRMNTAIKMKAAKMSAWAYAILMSALMLIVGLFILFNQGAVISLIGWAMLVAAILGIVDDIMYLYRIDTFSDAVKNLFSK